MTEVVLLFLFLSLLFYLVFGGADFGAGILELFSRKKNRPATAALTYRVIGPVWEANHIWLIIVIVILWTGFPEVYSRITTNLHIPLLALLMAIIFRGTAFVFRHYDAIKDDTHRIYDRVFRISSLLAAFFIGVIAAAVMMGRIPTETGSFASSFLFPWFNGFAFSTGLFVVSLFAYLAAVYLIAESGADPGQQQRYIAKTKLTSQTTVAAGLLVFLTAWSYEVPLLDRFWDHPLSLLSLGLATASLPLFWFWLRKKKYARIRLVAGAQAALILSAWLIAQFPHMVVMAGGDHLSVGEVVAPEKTIQLLGWALLVASVLILPGLYHLMKSFGMLKWDR